MFDREQQRDQDPVVEAQSPEAEVTPAAEQAGGNQAALSERQGGEQQGAQPAAPGAEGAKRQPTLDKDGAQYYGIANQITSLMEGGTTKGDYGALTIVKDGGIVSYGKHQATLASGSLGDVINAYLESANSPTAKSLTAYQPRVGRRDASLRDDQGFLNDLKNAAKEQKMKDAQDMVFNQGYWKPAVKAAAGAGIQSPLGLALLYDTKIQGGMETLMDRTRAALGGDVGDKVGEKTIDEQTFLKVFVEKRAARLEDIAKSAEAKGETVRARAVRGSVYRCNGFMALIEANNLNVAGPSGDVQMKGPGGAMSTIEGFDEAEVANGRDGSEAPQAAATQGQAPSPEGASGQQTQLPAAAGVIGTATVKSSQLNVRKGPGTQFASQGRLNRGAEVEVVGTEGEWLKINYNNNTAYIHGGFTTMKVTAPVIGSATVTTIGLNVRQGPVATAAKVGFLRQGDTVEVVGQQGKWFEVKYNGQLAYIFGDFANFTALPAGLEGGPIEVPRGNGEGSGEAPAPAAQPAAAQPGQPEQSPEAAAPQEQEQGAPAAPVGAPIDVAIVTSATLNVRSGPGTASDILGQLKVNDKVDMTGRSGEWLQIVFEGKAGFVHGRYTALKSELPPSAADMLQSLNLAMEKAPARLKDLMAMNTLNPAELGEARTLIKAMPAADQGNFFEVLQAKSAYASQRDNQATENGKKVETAGGNMCNLTSLAMCLQYLGIANPHPDMQYEDALEKVRQDKGLPHRTYSSGWGGVAEAMGVTWGFAANPGAGKLEKKFWEVTVRPILRSGKSVMMSITGHIVRVQGVGESGIVVDDPYGIARLTPNGRRWVEKNEYGKEDDVGNDNVWSYEEMGNHISHWVAWFSK
jgi:uncharacterized protein YgiM (DUF1202 family)